MAIKKFTRALAPCNSRRPGCLSTVELVQNMAAVLCMPDIPVSLDVAVASALTRLVQSEPDNRELDEWRDFIRDCAEAHGDLRQAS